MMGSNNEIKNKIDEVDANAAIEIINSYGTKLIWLGAEPASYVSSILGVDESRILKIDGSEILGMEYSTAQLISNNVLVCYNGKMAAHLASDLKNKYNITTYILKNGLMSFLSRHKNYNKPI